MESESGSDVEADDWHFPGTFQELVAALQSNYLNVDFPNKEIFEYEHPELYAALKQNNTLKQLALEGNNLGAAGAEVVAKALQNHTRLAELYIESNDILDEGTQSIAQSLTFNTSIVSLYLRYNQIGAGGAKDLGEMLRNNTTLTTLSLRGNDIDAEGAQGLCEGLKNNQALSTLSLRDNSLGVEGARHVAECLKHNKALVEIFLETNNITDEGALVLLNALSSNNTLTFIDLMDNGVTPEILKRIRKDLEFRKRLQKAAYLQAKESTAKVAWKRSKLMVIGEGAVGKTATIRSLLNRPFDERWDSTVGVSLTEAVAGRNQGQATGGSSAWFASKKMHFASSFLHREGAKLYHSNTYKRQASATVKRESRENHKHASQANIQKGEIAKPLVVQKKAPSATMDHSGRKKKVKGFEKESFSKAALEVGSVKISIWDYGGQAVFYTLHHVFLTKWGVYLLVFNPKAYLIKPAATESYLRFWLHSVRLHAPEAPIIMVATFACEMDRRKWNKVNKMLRKLLQQMTVEPPLVRCGDSPFFAIDNKTKRGVQALRLAAEETIVQQDVVNFPVSLQWMQALDAALDHKAPWIKLQHFKAFAAAVQVTSSEEINAMLALFHELGVILHFTSTESLQELVVTDPDWLIDNVSKVIRDASLHSVTSARLTSAGLGADLETLHKRALASRDLLEFFWGRQEAIFLLDLMRSLFLVSNWKFRTNEEVFLVPSMIRNDSEALDLKGESERVKREGGAACEIRFEYLLPGVLERLVCLCVEYSSTREGTREPKLAKSSCRVWLNRSYFVDLCATGEIIEVVISDAAKVVTCMNVLTSMLRKVNLDTMGSGLIYSVFMEEAGQMVPYSKAKARFSDDGAGQSVDDQNMTSVEFGSFLDSF